MRFLADAGISPKTVEFLRSRGHDAVHVRERALQVTDRPSVVIFRLADERADSVNRRLEAVLAEQAASIEAGAESSRPGWSLAEMLCYILSRRISSSGYPSLLPHKRLPSGSRFPPLIIVPEARLGKSRVNAVISGRE